MAILIGALTDSPLLKNTTKSEKGSALIKTAYNARTSYVRSTEASMELVKNEQTLKRHRG
jgi:hypothetical protein